MKINAHALKRSFAFILKELGIDVEQMRILGRWEKLTCRYAIPKHLRLKTPLTRQVVVQYRECLA